MASNLCPLLEGCRFFWDQWPVPLRKKSDFLAFSRIFWKTLSEMLKGTEVYDDFSPNGPLLSFVRARDHSILMKNIFFVDFMYFFMFFTILVRKGTNILKVEWFLWSPKTSCFERFRIAEYRSEHFIFRKCKNSREIQNACPSDASSVSTEKLLLELELR